MPVSEVERKVRVTCPACNCTFTVIITWSVGRTRVDCTDCSRTFEFEVGA